MFNLLFLILGTVIGLLLAPQIGACDGSFRGLIQNQIQQLSAPPQDSGSLTPDLQLDYEATASIYDADKLFDLKISVEEKAASASSYITEDGFGFITPCALDQPINVSGDGCIYAPKSKIIGSEAGTLLVLSESDTFLKAAAVVGETLLRNNCNKTFPHRAITQSFISSDYAFAAQDFLNSVEQILDVGMSSEIPLIVDLGQLHYMFLDLQRFSTNYSFSPEESNEAPTTRISHPAGDVFMYHFLLETYRTVSDVRASVEACS